MICKKCQKKEHTCSSCNLDDEQEFYLHRIGLCSNCWTPEMSAIYWDKWNELDEMKEAVAQEIEKKINGAQAGN